MDVLGSLITGDRKGAVMAKELRDMDKARQRVLDARHCQSAKARRFLAPPAGQGHGQFCEVEQDEPRMRRQAYALVKADRKTVKEAAKVLGVTIREVEQLVASESEQRTSPTTYTPTADARSHDDRVREFRQMMRERSDHP